MKLIGTELKYTQDDDWIKASFLKMHEDIVCSFNGLPHPEYVSINILEEAVDHHMETNIPIEKNFDLFYKKFVPYITMREKKRKKRVQSILETVKLDEAEERDKYIRINNPSEAEYVQSSERVLKHVLKLYFDSTQSYKIFDQFKPIYEKKFVKTITEFLKKDSKYWTIVEFKDIYVELESFIFLLEKVPNKIFFPLFEIDTTLVKDNLFKTMEELRNKMKDKLEEMFSDKIQHIKTNYDSLYERMREKVTNADEYSEMEQFMYELIQEKILLSNKAM